MKTYFIAENVSFSDKEKFIIIPKDYDFFRMNISKGGSYAVLPARILGISYPTYLKYLREKYPNSVTLEGKNNYYIREYWCEGKDLQDFLSFLNQRAEHFYKI